MTSLNDQLRLEILASTSGNVIANHSGQNGNTTGWGLVTFGFGGAPWPGSALTAVSGKPFGYEGKAIEITHARQVDGGVVFFDSPAVASEEFPVAGLQYVNAALTLRSDTDADNNVQMGLQFFDAGGTKIREVMWAKTSGSGVTNDRPVPGNGQATLTLDGQIQQTTGTILADGRRAPSGTVKARVVARVSTGYPTPVPATAIKSYLYELMVVVGSTDGSVAGPVFSDVAETWQNLLPKSLRATVNRGGDVDGVTDDLDAGLMVANVKDPLVTPDNNDRVRPGRPIRLLALNGSTWEPVFRGKIVQASTSYAGEVPVVSITATDATADLENFPQPIGKSGTFKQRVNSAMLNVPGVPYTVVDAATNVTQSTISADENGSALSQLKLIRDSLRGLFYVDRSNTLQCFANASYPSQAPTVTYSDDADDTGAIFYTGIDTNFDSKNAVNTLTVTKNALSEPNGSKVYGPFVNQASVDAWGPISANLDVNDGTPATLAGAYLAVYSEPEIFTESITFNATDDISQAIVRELYEAAQVKFAKAGVDAVYRTIAIEHEITPEAWIVTVNFKPLESTSSIVVTNPPGGASSGPKDLLPFTREIQTGEVSITTSTTGIRSATDTFPKPYESAPRVFAIARSGLPGTRVTEVTATSTATGCELSVGAAVSSAGAVTVIWVAIPT